MTYDAIVLGLGGMGAAAASALARRGLRVLGLDGFARGHLQGSSHGHTRIIRTAYFEHPDYVPLCQSAFIAWFDVEQRTGRHLLTACDCLNVGPPEADLVQGVRSASARHALAVEVLEAARLRSRFPQFLFGDECIGVIESSSGFLYVDECVQALQDDAIAHKAELRFGERVIEWTVSGDSVAVRTAWETLSAARLVIAAGAWSAQVLMDLALPLTVMRQVPQWFRPTDPAAFRRDRFPIFIAETPHGHFYGVPMIDPRGVKVARHYGAPELPGPQAARYDVTADDEVPVRAFIDQHMPTASGPRMAASVCLYTLTPDRHFIIDRHPRHPQVAVAAGFSGHGFKFAPVVGEALADLVMASTTDHEIGLFQLSRFSRK